MSETDRTFRSPESEDREPSLPKQRRLSTAVPWVLPIIVSAGILPYEGERWYSYEKAIAEIKARLPEGMRSLVGDMKYLGETGPYVICSFRDILSEEQVVFVAVEGKYFLHLRFNESENHLIHMTFSRNGAPILGAAGTRGGEFPKSFWVVPQSGPHAKKFTLIDSDLDGVFEIKLRGVR